MHVHGHVYLSSLAWRNLVSESFAYLCESREHVYVNMRGDT